jgi:hypothetical protein
MALKPLRELSRCAFALRSTRREKSLSVLRFPFRVRTPLLRHNYVTRHNYGAH